MVKLPDGTEWIRPAAAAELLPGISPGRIRVWVHRGKVRSIRVGRATFVAWPDLLDKIDTVPLPEVPLDFASVQILFTPPELEAAKQALKLADEQAADHKIAAAYQDYQTTLAALDDVRDSYGIKNLAVAVGIILSIFENHATDLAEGWEPEDEPPRWVPARTLLPRSLPSDSARVLKQAIEKAVREETISPKNPWRLLELLCADYLAGP